MYVVQEDGTVAVLLINKNNGINAWSQYVTDGKIISLSVLVDKVYVVVKRGETFSLEVFDEDVSADMAKKFFFDEVEDMATRIMAPTAMITAMTIIIFFKISLSIHLFPLI